MVSGMVSLPKYSLALSTMITLPVCTASSMEYLGLCTAPGNQVSCFLQERAHMFPSIPFAIEALAEAFLVALDV